MDLLLGSQAHLVVHVLVCSQRAEGAKLKQRSKIAQGQLKQHLGDSKSNVICSSARQKETA